MSFLANSTSHSLNGTILAVSFQTTHGTTHTSTIDLDDKYGNEGGKFVYGGKYFSLSASHIYIEGTILHATLRRVIGSIQASVDLNDHIENSNGMLIWNSIKSVFHLCYTKHLPSCCC